MLPCKLFTLFFTFIYIDTFSKSIFLLIFDQETITGSFFITEEQGDSDDDEGLEDLSDLSDEEDDDVSVEMDDSGDYSWFHFILLTAVWRGRSPDILT